MFTAIVASLIPFVLLYYVVALRNRPMAMHSHERPEANPAVKCPRCHLISSPGTEVCECGQHIAK